MILFGFSVLKNQCYAQYVSRDNYTGDWNYAESWNENNYPGTSISGSNVDCYGYLTSTYCLDYDDGLFTVHDTLVVYGSFSLLNRSRLVIEQGGILIVLGDYYSNNKVEVENSGYLIVTGQFRMQGSDNQGFFHNTGGKVFLFDPEPDIKGGRNYADLACTDTADYPVNCGYGNAYDLLQDQISRFFAGFDYSPDDTLTMPCIMVSFEADQTEVCMWDTVTFFSQSTGISINSEFHWNFGEGAVPLEATGEGPHKVAYSTPGYKSVKLIVEDMVSVVTRQSAYIHVKEIPDLVIRDTSRCGTGDVMVAGYSRHADLVLFSLDGGESVYHQAYSNPFTCSLNVIENTTIRVWANAVDTILGCETGWRVSTMVDSYPLPVVRITGDTVSCEGRILYLETNDVFDGYLWNDGTTEPTYVTNTSGQVSVSVWNEFDCSNADTITINNCKQENIFNTGVYSFTPNDDGINDCWVINEIEAYPLAKIYVYNSSGKKVFESAGGYTNDWDGYYNGERLSIDSYYFLIDFSAYEK
jgi:gliding motility-associated-like protein